MNGYSSLSVFVKKMSKLKEKFFSQQLISTPVHNQVSNNVSHSVATSQPQFSLAESNIVSDQSIVEALSESVLLRHEISKLKEKIYQQEVQLSMKISISEDQSNQKVDMACQTDSYETRDVACCTSGTEYKEKQTQYEQKVVVPEDNEGISVQVIDVDNPQNKRSSGLFDNVNTMKHFHTITMIILFPQLLTMLSSQRAGTVLKSGS